MKYRSLFVFAVLLFSSSYAMAQKEYWYEGCPKYSEKGLSELIQRTKTTPVKSASELQQYSKGEVEVYLKKAKCDMHNLEKYAKQLEKQLKENEDIQKSQTRS
ncbi:hypothetical protein KKJ01_20010 [Xenorhabdus bovienii]|uniref:Uncharacterized protein n=1 Tax=Xenorhabdus bovienii TaxID=40576 RepID=A0AAJ1JAZ2_XENBV|nr:hypothetical protein [Xenorhabdus bovienii]MDE1476516.1 hypothetical protein [Xenorhabdus bovienii]MDE1480439.1 hypothetical protein [Xenorhabdus bovienii]MDE9484197.1 hypothetical protein [Xenorhabdus bovienii]MDE9512123.1 hypothetical protein [Xenorhabdus bovienii]MDE9523784.1 hypothetical protein [Xenorhabdus bovienii]